MKIRFERGDTAFEVERDPIPPERFAAVCKLAEAAIGGAVLLGAIHMIGAWAVAWAVGALVLVGLYKMILWLCKSC